MDLPENFGYVSKKTKQPSQKLREFGEGPEADRQGVIGPLPIGHQPMLLQDILRV